jgi:hypothetical protein
VLRSIRAGAVAIEEGANSCHGGETAQNGLKLRQRSIKKFCSLLSDPRRSTAVSAQPRIGPKTCIVVALFSLK